MPPVDYSSLVFPSPAPAPVNAPGPAPSPTPSPTNAPSPTPAPTPSPTDDPNAANPFASMFKSGNNDQQPDFFTMILLAFLSMLLGGKDSDAPGADGGSTKTQDQINTEKGTTQDFDKTAANNLTTTNIKTTDDVLTSLRTQAETANGGKHVEAIMPVAGDVVISSGFGHRDAPDLPNGKKGSTEHAGLDIARSDKSTTPEIVSTMPGVVVGVGWKGGYGNTVDILDIYGVRHRYGHLATGTTQVKIGDVVTQGETIATMGSTGSSNGLHVHYEQRDANGTAVDPTILGHDKWKVGEYCDLSKSQQMIAQQHSNSYQPDVASSGGTTQQPTITTLPNTIQTAVSGMDFSYLKQGSGYVNTSVTNPKQQQTGTKTIGA